MEISGVYKITNTITKDFYIGSSKNVKRRLVEHKCQSRWNRYPNNPLYKDIQKYGTDKFVFEILTEAEPEQLKEAEPEQLKEAEQEFIEKLQPTYNQMNANGLNIDKRKKYKKSDKCKEYNKKYKKTDKCKEYNKKYKHQLCSYNGEILTLSALSSRFAYRGIPHPTIEAKKYLIQR